jgi:hypothetical protein
MVEIDSFEFPDMKERQNGETRMKLTDRLLLDPVDQSNPLALRHSELNSMRGSQTPLLTSYSIYK